MGYFAVAAPGTPSGPCVSACAHVDCAETRRMLDVPCGYCREKVKPGDKVYLDGGGFQHAACVWAAKSR